MKRQETYPGEALATKLPFSDPIFTCLGRPRVGNGIAKIAVGAAKERTGEASQDGSCHDAEPHEPMAAAVEY